MQIVIDINENDYKTLMINGGNCSFSMAERIIDSVYQGEKLPKGHGRLIDADWVLNKMDTTDAQPRTQNECYAWDFAKTLFKSSPTIIEADKEEQHENNTD